MTSVAILIALSERMRRLSDEASALRPAKHLSIRREIFHSIRTTAWMRSFAHDAVDDVHRLKDLRRLV